MSESLILNLSDRHVKRELMTRIGALTGEWRIEMRHWRPRRSNRANAFYWAAVVPTFRQFLRDQGQEFSADEVHEFLKMRFLPAKELCNPETGEVLGTIAGSTAALDVAQFSEYLERVMAWLGEQFGIEVPAPELSIPHRKGAAA